MLAVDGVNVRTEYRAARFPADYQIGLHLPRAAKARTGFISYYANVFNGHEGWTVESRVGDRQWNAMRRVIEWDPSYAEQYLAQDALEQPLATPRLPDPTVCYHLWRTYLPADLAPGTYPVEVRATDPAGAVHTAKGEIRIVTVP